MKYKKPFIYSLIGLCFLYTNVFAQQFNIYTITTQNLSESETIELWYTVNVMHKAKGCIAHLDGTYTLTQQTSFTQIITSLTEDNIFIATNTSKQPLVAEKYPNSIQDIDNLYTELEFGSILLLISQQPQVDADIYLNSKIYNMSDIHKFLGMSKNIVTINITKNSTVLKSSQEATKNNNNTIEQPLVTEKASDVVEDIAESKDEN